MADRDRELEDRERNIEDRERELKERELAQKQRELEEREREVHDREREIDEKDGQESELEDSRMPFLDHLRELRGRLRNAILALAVGFVIAFIFSQELYFYLVRPLVSILMKRGAEDPELFSQALYYNSVVEPFTTYFSIAFWGGLFVASPFVFHQLWKFVAPGLYKKEQSYGIIFAACSALFFLGGASFCYFLVLEPVYDFLLGFSTHNMAQMSRPFGVEYQLGESIALQPLLTMKEYLSFAKKLLLGFGLIFELPLFIFFLSIAGVVDHRTLWKFNRWAVVIAFLGSAALTPPDIYSQLFMAGPIVVLYNLSIVIAFFITRRRERRQAELV